MFGKELFHKLEHIFCLCWLATQAACCSRPRSTRRRRTGRDLFQAWWVWWLQLGQQWTISCLALYLTRHSCVLGVSAAQPTFDDVCTGSLMVTKAVLVVRAPRGGGRKSSLVRGVVSVWQRAASSTWGWHGSKSVDKRRGQPIATSHMVLLWRSSWTSLTLVVVQLTTTSCRCWKVLVDLWKDDRCRPSLAGISSAE